MALKKNKKLNSQIKNNRNLLNKNLKRLNKK